MKTAHAVIDDSATMLAPLPNTDAINIAVIGLGYVGLPLAAAFARNTSTVGFDIDHERVTALRSGRDRTQQIDSIQLRQAEHLSLTCEPKDLKQCNVYIITVPTPVDRYKRPDLRMLQAASRTVGRSLGRGDVVVYESTVYPGATEEVCAPILECESGLVRDQDFHLAYSPERINPGDRTHGLSDIRKIVAASNEEAREFLSDLYGRVIEAGIHRASSIRVAEAAKVIENTQRDVNIALINELAMLFNRLQINTREVLEAAGTKWNFLPFRPGLVGGHCIGVDPYYLTQKAQEIGFFPEMILAGRRINDGMGRYVVEALIRLMARSRIQIVDARILILGATFKENCPDLRNSQVMDMIEHLRFYHAKVAIHDPWVDADELETRCGVTPVTDLRTHRYDAVILAVPHDAFVDMPPQKLRALTRKGGILYDVKGVLPEGMADGTL